MSTSIRDIGIDYWLASRDVDDTYSGDGFNVRNVYSRGYLTNSLLCNVNASGSTHGYSVTNGLRPVFILKSGIKITGGTGEEGNPYTLGV